MPRRHCFFSVRAQHRLGISLITGLLMAETVTASWYGPEPFRRERIEGRDFEYDEESFLHRISYQPMPLLQPAQRPPRDGVFGTGGSTRSNELYVREQVQLSLPTDSSAYLGYRFLRNEDFDGHYDQQFLGAGYQSDSWKLLFWGDVTGNKRDSDMQLEWQIQDASAYRLRLILAAPDALYNRKTDEADEYLDAPLTWYAEGDIAVASDIQLYGFINYNQPTRFLSTELAADVEDEQLSAGVGLGWSHLRWHYGVELEGLTGTRTRQGFTDGSVVEQDLTRDFAQLTLEARRPTGENTWLWFGLRHLQFDENDRRPYDAEHWLEQAHEETYLYAGRQWHLGPHWQFVPSLIGGYVEVQETYPLNASENEEQNGFIGKLVPAFVLGLGSKQQGSLTLNPTLYLHELGFGGGNIQLHFPL